MEVTIYKGRHSPAPGVSQFLVLPKGQSTSVVPDEVLKELGELSLFKELAMQKGESRVAVDVDAVLSGIEEQGYHVARTEVRISEQVIGQSTVG